MVTPDTVVEIAQSFDAVVVDGSAELHAAARSSGRPLAISQPDVAVSRATLPPLDDQRREFVIAGRGAANHKWAIRHLVARSRCSGHTVAYGPLPDHVMDVRLPPTPPGMRPPAVVVLVHGGFWRDQFLRDAFDLVADDLTARGFATVNIEYRRSGASGGGWPTSLNDIEAALEYVAQNAESLGVDAERVAIVGHSAGGHLALCGAGFATVSAAVALAPVTDLHSAYRQNLGSGAALEFIGIPPDHGPDTWTEASPIARVPTAATTVLVHGDADEHVPVEHSRSYVAAAQAAGDASTLVELAGVDHVELLDPWSPAWPVIIEELDRVLR